MFVFLLVRCFYKLTYLKLGRWLFDLASQLPPSAILRASDVSTALFPESRPSNVSFTQCSVTSLPSGLSDRFDFVHQQLLGTCLTEDDWIQALNEMYRVLSPGGWIELNEIVGLHAGPNTESLWALAVQQYGKNLIDINLVGALPDFLKKVGFVDIRINRRPLTLYGCSVRQAKARKCALTWLDSAFSDIPHAERNAYNLDILMKTVEKEWSYTEGSELDYRIVCAQKPLMKF